MPKIVRRTYEKIQHEIELFSLIAIAIVSGFIYGIIEVHWIPTGQPMGAKIFGYWYWYHVWMMALLAAVGFICGLSHLNWMNLHKKKYLLLASTATIPLSACVEDIAWYLSSWQPILKNDWTTQGGWAIPLGFTYLPLWYLGCIAVSWFLFWLADYYAEQGFRAKGSPGLHS